MQNNEVIDNLNNLSPEKQELFLKHFLKEHGFSSVAIIARNSGKEITAIAFIEIGIISYQFFIKFNLFATKIYICIKDFEKMLKSAIKTNFLNLYFITSILGIKIYISNFFNFPLFFLD